MDVQAVYEWQEERVRVYKPKKHDRLYISRNVYKVKLGKYIPDTPLMCMRLIKRDKWWQFWKPRYKGAIYEMMEDI